MKVLKYGEGYPKTATCGNCHSELQYKLKDIFYRSDRVRSADPLIAYEDVDVHYIWCPVCGQDITVSSKVTYTQIVDKWWSGDEFRRLYEENKL